MLGSMEPPEGGLALGGSVKLGGSAAITTAPTIMDTNGYNSGVSGTIGVLGGAASGDWSHGTTRDNQVYNSYGGVPRHWWRSRGDANEHMDQSHTNGSIRGSG